MAAAAAAAADGGGGGGGGDAALYAALRAARPFFLVAGPNVIESRSHLERVARHVKAVVTDETREAQAVGSDGGDPHWR